MTTSAPILTESKLASENEVSGVYSILAQAPKIAALVRDLDLCLQTTLTMPERLRALSILTSASRKGTTNASAFLQLTSVKESGLSTEVLNYFKGEGNLPKLALDEQITYDFCTSLTQTGHVKNHLFEQASTHLGKVVCLEITKICGFTIYLSNLLNTMPQPNRS